MLYIHLFICQSNTFKTVTRPILNIINWKNICFKAKADNEKYLLKQRLKKTSSPRHCFFIAITSGAHGPPWLLCQLSFLWVSRGSKVSQQKGDNTFVDHTTSYMPPQLYSSMPEEENQNDCFVKSIHVPLGASLGESDKRAKLSANEISINKSSGESAWTLLQIIPWSQLLCPAEMYWCPRNCSQDVLIPPTENPWISLQECQEGEVWGLLLAKLHYSFNLTDFNLNLH